MTSHQIAILRQEFTSHSEAYTHARNFARASGIHMRVHKAEGAPLWTAEPMNLVGWDIRTGQP